jgi:hypothetical protein
MITFESDIAPAEAITDLPYGTPDQLDVWTQEDQDWHDHLEAIFDPDGPFIVEVVTW